MFTRCPSCRAAFRITQQQLEIATGVVRCGMCEHVFDARLFIFNEHLEQEHPPQEDTPSSELNIDASTLSSEQTITDNTLSREQSIQEVDVELTTDGNNSAIDLEVLDRELHGQQSAELSEVTNIVDDDLQLEQNTAQTQDTEPQESQAPETAIPKIIADQVSNLDKESYKFRPMMLLGGLLTISLITLLGAQVIAALKTELIPQPYREQACKWLSCTIETPRAINKIEVLNRSIYTHPTEAEALMVTLTIVNRAQFSQPYPIIQLRFLNIAGDVIAARQFSANHYLREKWVAKSLMLSSTPLSIQLEVHDVGEEVVSYDFDFL